MNEDERCTQPGCQLRWAVACAHTARCGDHMLGKICEAACCDEIGVAFALFLRDVCAPAARLAAQLQPVRLSGLEGLTEVYEVFYPSYRERYDDEGAPLGPYDASMWRWHEERFSPDAEPQVPVLRLVASGGNLIH